jgi:hypothetical protein
MLTPLMTWILAKPRTIWGALCQAICEIVVILATWIAGSLAMAWDLPSWSELGFVAAGWLVVTAIRFFVTRSLGRSPSRSGPSGADPSRGDEG